MDSRLILERLEANRKELEKQAKRNEKIFKKIDKIFSRYVLTIRQ